MTILEEICEICPRCHCDMPKKDFRGEICKWCRAKEEER